MNHVDPVTISLDPISRAHLKSAIYAVVAEIASTEWTAEDIRYFNEALAIVGRAVGADPNRSAFSQDDRSYIEDVVAAALAKDPPSLTE